MSQLQGPWQKRYGSGGVPAPDLPRSPDGAAALFEQLLAHRTVRAYLDQPLAAGTLQWLVAAAQSAASSSNLQTWRVLAVVDREPKQRRVAGGAERRAGGRGTSYIGALRNQPEQVAAELRLPPRVFPVFGLPVLRRAYSFFSTNFCSRFEVSTSPV